MQTGLIVGIGMLNKWKKNVSRYTTKKIVFFFSYKPIIKYIDEQFERFLNDESGLNRRNISDNRVHCCFYFISPWGHGYVLSIFSLFMSALAKILTFGF